MKVRVSYDTGIAVSPPDASFHRELVSDVLGQASDASRVDWSPDGEHVVFNIFNRERAVDVIYIIDAEGGEPVAIAEGLAPAWQPDSEGD